MLNSQAHGTPNAHQAQPGSQQERQCQPDAPHAEYVQHKTGGAVARTLHGTAGHDGGTEHGLGPGFDAQNLSTQSDDSRIGGEKAHQGGGKDPQANAGKGHDPHAKAGTQPGKTLGHILPVGTHGLADEGDSALWMP